MKEKSAREEFLSARSENKIFYGLNIPLMTVYRQRTTLLITCRAHITASDHVLQTQHVNSDKSNTWLFRQKKRDYYIRQNFLIK